MVVWPARPTCFVSRREIRELRETMSAALQARVPDRVVEVPPPAPATLADRTERIHDLDAVDVLRVLVADLQLDAQPQRGPVLHWERFAVHTVSEDRLRMRGIEEIEALVVVVAVEFDLVEAVKHHVAGALLQPSEPEHARE